MAMFLQQQEEERSQKANMFLMGPQDSSSAAPSFGVTVAKSPISHTQYPYVTGSSVLGIKYNDGVLIAADCGGLLGWCMRAQLERILPDTHQNPQSLEHNPAGEACLLSSQHVACT
ncbi:hypothetical protein L7F22_022241 [Adiantum nelumboides]|nr:hypothetical protein [Adiantum nelumboides]